LADDTAKFYNERPALPEAAPPFTRQQLKAVLLRRPLNEQVPILRCNSHRQDAPAEFQKDESTFRNITHQGHVYWSGNLWEQNWLAEAPYTSRETIVLFGLQGPPFYKDVAPSIPEALDLRPWTCAFGDHPWWWTVPYFDVRRERITAATLAKFFRGGHGRTFTLNDDRWWLNGLVQVQGKTTSNVNEAYSQSFTQSFVWERTDLQVDRKFRRASWLQGTVWTAPTGQTCGWLVWRYAHGHSEKVPLVYGQNTARFWADDEQIATEIDFLAPAWKAEETAEEAGKRRELRLYRQTWENPHPELPVAFLNFVSNPESPAAPFIVAFNLYP
jgi:hypothetical protein